MALPETGYGLVPSAGLSYYLGRMENGVRPALVLLTLLGSFLLSLSVTIVISAGQVGMYLGLSGATLRGEQAYWAGVTDYFSTAGACVGMSALTFLRSSSLL
jgi:enoyl-CoA hydratase/carnithine racemase